MRRLFLAAMFVASLLGYAQAQQQVTIVGDLKATKTITTTLAANGLVMPLNGRTCVGLRVSTSFSGSLLVAGSVDYSTVGAGSANYTTTTSVAVTNGAINNAITTTGDYQINSAGFSAIEVYAVSLVSGTPTVTMVATSGVCTVMADNNIPVTGTVTATLSTAGYDAAVPVAPTIQNAAYVSGNAVGALQSVAVFRNVSQPSGILNGVLLAWKGTETAPLTFYIFDTNPTGSTCNDRAAFSLAAADVPKLAIAPFTLTAAAPTGTTSTSAGSTFAPISMKNQDGTPTTNLYVCAVSGGSFTPAVGDLTYKMTIAQD